MKKANSIYAVLTGDIVKSSKLNPIELKMVLQQLREGVEQFKTAYPESIYGRLDIFSGDSWQLLMPKWILSLRAALYLRAQVKAIKGLGVDTRVAIAWGSVDEETLNPERISESTGEAFTLSGRALSEMDRQDHLSYLTNANHTAQGSFVNIKFLSISIFLLDEVSSRWTQKQTQALSGILLGQNQKQIADELAISQPTVNRHLQAAGWKRTKKYLHELEYSLQRLY